MNVIKSVVGVLFFAAVVGLPFWLFLVADDICPAPPPCPSRKRVGVFIMGSGKYLPLLKQLVGSMEEHFCAGGAAHVHYLLFVDELAAASWEPTNRTRDRSYTLIEHHQQGWPKDTLYIFRMLLSHKESVDYVGNFD